MLVIYDEMNRSRSSVEDTLNDFLAADDKLRWVRIADADRHQLFEEAVNAGCPPTGRHNTDDLVHGSTPCPRKRAWLSALSGDGSAETITSRVFMEPRPSCDITIN